MLSPALSASILRPTLWWQLALRAPAHPRPGRFFLCRQHLRGSTHSYQPPDFKAKLHNSLTWGWWPLEVLPKRAKWKEWPERPSLLGLYIPFVEPRVIPKDAMIHQSANDRREG